MDVIDMSLDELRSTQLTKSQSNLYGFIRVRSPCINVYTLKRFVLEKDDAACARCEVALRNAVANYALETKTHGANVVCLIRDRVDTYV